MAIVPWQAIMNGLLWIRKFKEGFGLKEQLLAYLKNQTAFFSSEDVSVIFTAQDMAVKFSVKRNTISHYLNQLTEEGKIVKIATRPVYFFHKQAFEVQNYPLSKNVYRSLEEITAEKPIFDKKENFFSNVIGNKGSLAGVIEQIKMAAFYPNGGLPFLLTGESGTGKSFLVRLFHQYCIMKELLAPDAPLITINCAQYANNQELLTSNLFGHVKGAFTGADEERSGAFEAADGGILFLDEVHRLNAEGQEKLFTYLDQGFIYRMGDTAHPVSVNCRLVFATTEDLQQTFLTTFLRRIPIQVKLPSLDERTYLEKKQLILQAFYEEQGRIDIPLEISPQVIEQLAAYHFAGNVGELKSTIKIITAKSYTASLNRKEAKIQVTLYHLPEQLLQNMEQISQAVAKPVVINGQKEIQLLIKESEPEQEKIIQTYERILLSYVENKQNLLLAVESISNEIEWLFENLLLNKEREKNQKTMIFITERVQQMMEQIEHSYQISFNGSMIYTVSYYLWLRRNVEWLIDDREKATLIEQFLKDVKKNYAVSDQYAEKILQLVQKTLDIDLTNMDRAILTIYINNVGYTKESKLPKAIIVAHGYATASSIASVANRLLNELVFQSFDMPLEVTPKQIAEHIIKYIQKNDVSNGLVILFDMGSLKEIYQYFPKELQAPIVLMNNVTTSLALAVGECIRDDNSLNEIPEMVTQQNKNEWEIIFPKTKKEQVVITTCSTGIGTAVQIASLLEKSIPDHLAVHVIPYEFSQLEKLEKVKQALSAYEIVGIIGTNRPRNNEFPFISLEELIAGMGTEVLLSWLHDELDEETVVYVNNQMIRNFSLDRVIQSVTILDTEKVISQMEVFVENLERRWRKRISNDRKVALFVHTSCLIERLIRNVPIETYDRYEEILQCHKSALDDIKEAFSVIEKVYSVKIPLSEVCYIYDVLFGNTDITMNDNDF
jgi:sigma-54 dependent transcriptional regulator of gfr operon